MESKNINIREMKEILEMHELWLATNGENGRKANLSNTDLRAFDFEGINLRKADLQGANLQSVNLKGVDLQEANLQGASLQNATLTMSILRGANLNGAILRESVLIKAIMTKADLRNSILTKANLESAVLTRAELDGATLEGANFKDAVLDPWLKQKVADSTEELLKKEIAQKSLQISNLEKQLKNAGISSKEYQEIHRDLEIAKKEQQQHEQQLLEIDQENRTLKQKLEEKLSEQIQHAIDALKTALTNTDEQIKIQKTGAIELRRLAKAGLITSVAAVLIIPFILLPLVEWSGKDFLTSFAYFGKFSMIFYTFPVIVLLLASTALLRHEQKIMAEIRHFSDQKHAIELYAGLLKAAQHAAANIKDPERAEKYVEETFSMIRKKILDGKDEDTKLDPVAQADQDKQILGTARDTLRLVSDVARLVKMTKSS